MSLIVEPTLPYTPSQLKLEEAKRWNRLLPLMRPSLKIVKSPSGQTVLLDNTFAESTNVLIAAVGTAGNISSKILTGSYAAAFTLDQLRGSTTTAEDIAAALNSKDFPVDNGVIVIRAALKQDLRVNPDRKVVEVALVGELKVDHLLSLLGALNIESRSSFDQVKALAEHFIKSAARTTSKFQGRKSGDVSSVAHALSIEDFTSAKAAIERDLHHLLGSRPAPAGDVVYSVHFADINGLSRLENNILAHEISEYLARKKLPSYISQSTISDYQFQSRGWAISLCPIPKQYLSPQPRATYTLPIDATPQTKVSPKEGRSAMTFQDSKVREVITAGCESVIQAEPTITEYDTVVGDGDCGYTLRDGAKQVLSFINKTELANLSSALSDLVDELEVSMGGTSGALYCIFLSSFAQHLGDAQTISDALEAALSHLLTFTTARLGDRTVLDCLIPFVQTLKATGDSKAALDDAKKGAETTKTMDAQLGRSSYLDDASTKGVPDPGAWGLLKILEGMVDVSKR